MEARVIHLFTRHSTASLCLKTVDTRDVSAQCSEATTTIRAIVWDMTAEAGRQEDRASRCWTTPRVGLEWQIFHHCGNVTNYFEGFTSTDFKFSNFSCYVNLQM